MDPQVRDLDGNGGNGFSVGGGSTVSGNTAVNNSGDGISTNFGSTVSGNTVRINGGYGLDLSSETAYRENTITQNTTGTVNSSVNAGGNVCNSSLTCP